MVNRRPGRDGAISQMLLMTEYCAIFVTSESESYKCKYIPMKRVTLKNGGSFECNSKLLAVN